MNFIGYLSQKEVYVRLGLDEMRIVTLGAEIAVYGDACTTAEGPMPERPTGSTVRKRLRRCVKASGGM
jgi:hypothetical protein